MNPKFRTLLGIFALVVGSADASELASAAKATWRAKTPTRISSVGNGEQAKVLRDASVRFEGDVNWSEATLEFMFKRNVKLERIRVEILPSTKTSEHLGRGKAPLWLFDFKPWRKRDGKTEPLQWKSCHCPQAPQDESVPNCVDFLTDTGWKLPRLTKARRSYELILQLEHPVEMRRGDVFELVIDSGGSPELGVLARVRVSLPDTQSK